jgi:hypothetical protein
LAQAAETGPPESRAQCKRTVAAKLRRNGGINASHHWSVKLAMSVIKLDGVAKIVRSLSEENLSRLSLSGEF